MNHEFLSLRSENETLRRLASLLGDLRKTVGRDLCTFELETVIDGMRRAASLACAMHHSALDRLQHASKVFEFAAADGDLVSASIRHELVYELRALVERLDAQERARPRSGYSAFAGAGASLSAI